MMQSVLLTGTIVNGNLFVKKTKFRKPIQMFTLPKS